MIADELNPLTISHIARTTFCKPSGACKTTWIVDKGVMRANITSKLAARYNGAATRPQPDNQRGMSFDWYNT